MLGFGKIIKSRDLLRDTRSGLHAGAVTLERIRMLYKALPLSQGVALLVAFILVKVHSGYTGAHKPWWWFGALSGVLAARAASAWLYRRRDSTAGDESRWLRDYRIGAVVAGMLWGLAGILFYHPSDSNL